MWFAIQLLIAILWFVWPVLANVPWWIIFSPIIIMSIGCAAILYAAWKQQ